MTCPRSACPAAAAAGDRGGRKAARCSGTDCLCTGCLAVTGPRPDYPTAASGAPAEATAATAAAAADSAAGACCAGPRKRWP